MARWHAGGSMHSMSVAGYSVGGLPLEEHYTSSTISNCGSIDWTRLLLPLKRVTRR